LVSYIRDTTATADLIKRNGIDASEVHTSGRYSFIIILKQMIIQIIITIIIIISIEFRLTSEEWAWNGKISPQIYFTAIPCVAEIPFFFLNFLCISQCDFI
jgi:hypothetical protein